MDELTRSDVTPDVWLGHEKIEDAFHELMDRFYDVTARNQWVIAEVKGGFFRVMKETEADRCEDVVEYYTLRFNLDYSTTLCRTGDDFITIKEGQ